MVVCLGDAGDGISISSAKYALPMLYSINEKRRTDDIFVGAMKRRDSYVNFYLMAVAQTGANRGAGLRDHSRLSVSCENLAFGYSDAVNMWYREKSNFEATMSSLGMEALTSEADLKMVEDNNTKIIGHYTNLFLTDEQVMGVGFCQYGAAASCYNAHRNLKSFGYEYYTVDAYVALFNEYCETVDIKGAKEAVDAAKAALEQLKQQKYAKCTGHSFVSKSHFDATCTQDGGDLYECSKCGKPEYRNVVEAPGHTMVDGVCSVCSVTGPKTMNDIYITYDGKKTSISPVAIEEGATAILSFTFTSASEVPLYDEFLVEVADTSIAEYEPQFNSRGLIYVKKPGITTITVTSVVNPSLTKSIKIDATDVGGHAYSMAPIEPGSGIAYQTCTKCGRMNTYTIPTSVSKVYWSNGSGSTIVPTSYTVGDTVTVSPYFEPSNAQLVDFDVISSNPSHVSVERKSSYPRKAYLHVLEPGDVIITIVNKYDSSVKVEYVLDCAEENGHTYGSSEIDATNFIIKKTCTGCGHVDQTKLPSAINGFKVTKTFYANGRFVNSGSMLPLDVNQDYDTTIQVDFTPSASSCIYDFDFSTSDSSICTVEKTDERTANISFLKPGEVTVTATSKYTPSLKYEQKLYVAEPGGHTYEQLPSEKCLVHAATCTKAAEYYKVCSGCGYISNITYTSGKAFGHDMSCTFCWNSSSDVDYTIKCNRENKSISSGKVGSIREVSREYATCDKPEKITYEASVTYGGVTFKNQYTDITTKYADHAWDAGTVVTEPTCQAQGKKQYECRVCHETKDETLPLGCHRFANGYCVVCEKKCTQDECEHNFVEKTCLEALAQVASCTTSAKYYKVCEYCELISNETYSSGEPLGHAYENGICVTCGASNIVEGWYQTENGLVYRLTDGSMLSDGWHMLENVWYYFNADGTAQTGWMQLGSKWYFFNDKGAMQTGWQQLSGKWYYFASGGAMVTGWKQLSGKWYYFTGGGAMVTGWQQLSGKWYYFASGGAMVTGWQQLSGKWYYFASGGAMVTGWQQLSGKWYYFTGGGAMVTGWQQLSGKWYYFTNGGAMVTGWKQIGGKYYYFETSGVMAVSKWIGSYYVKSNGVMATNEWVDGGRYYVDGNGKWMPEKTR